MSTRKLHLSPLRTAVVALLGAGLVACGDGGGGGGSTTPPTLIDLTTANMTTVAHAAAAAPFALGAASSVTMSAEPGSATVGPAASPAARMVAAILPALQAGSVAGRARALAVYPGTPESCPYGGTVTVTLDDADGDYTFDIGDSMTFVFDHCRLSPDETTDGRADLILTRLDNDPVPSFTARMTMTGMSSVGTDGRHAARTDGIVRMDYTQFASTRVSLRLTAEGTVTARVQTHQGVDDTLGLQDGYTIESVNDDAQGVSTTTFGGLFHSATAGGMARTGTETAFQDRYDDPFPRTGVMRVSGQHGTMLVRALSAEQVRLELDHNDCGVAEQTRTESWDWLM